MPNRTAQPTEQQNTGLRFFVPGMPKTAGSKRVFINPKTGRPIVTDDNKKGKDWRASVQLFASQSMGQRPILDEPLQIAFKFILPRPKSHFGKKGVRPSASYYPITKPDVLKLARAAEDALTGIVWRDDSLIVDEHLFKRYSDEGKAGCWISVYRKP